jgi:hypothetical protein
MQPQGFDLPSNPVDDQTMKTHHQIKTILFSIGLFAALSARASTYYVDNKNTTGPGGSGTSGDPWHTLADIHGLSPGDIVWISGGPSGHSQTYSVPSQDGNTDSYWNPIGSTDPVNPITYTIWNDSSHNGTVIFDCTQLNGPNAGADGLWIGGYPVLRNIVVSGNAGDGQMHFALIHCGNAVFFVTSSSPAVLPNNVTFSYINMGFVTEPEASGAFDCEAPGGNNIHIDHCQCKVVNAVSDHFSHIAFASSTSAYDQSSASYNTIYVPRDQYGWGADAFQWSGTGFSIHDNTVIAYGFTSTDYASSCAGQHQDGVQALLGSYIKIYNNTFRDLGNSGIFIDGIEGDFSHVRIYNNVVFMSMPVNSSTYPRGIDVISDAHDNNNPNAPTSITFSDVVVANNVAANYPTMYGMSFFAPGMPATFTSCYMLNNISYNTASPYFQIDSHVNNSVPSPDNISASGSGWSFVHYTPLTAAPPPNQSTVYDFHLVPCDTTFKGLGANETSLAGTTPAPNFTTDKDGVSRPSTGAWDTGPYVADVVPTLSVAPSSYPYALYDNTGSTLSFTVTASSPYPVATDVYVAIGGARPFDGSSPGYANYHSSPPSDFTVSGCSPYVADGLFYIVFNPGDTSKTVTLTGTGTATFGPFDNLILIFSLYSGCYTSGASTEYDTYLYPGE